MQRNATVTIAHSRTADIEGKWLSECEKLLPPCKCVVGRRLLFFNYKVTSDLYDFRDCVVLCFDISVQLIYPYLINIFAFFYSYNILSYNSDCPSCWHHCRCCWLSRDGQEGNFYLIFLLMFFTLLMTCHINVSIFSTTVSLSAYPSIIWLRSLSCHFNCHEYQYISDYIIIHFLMF